MPIDTLKAARRLQEEETFSPEQAERIAEVLSELEVASVTKEDLEDVRVSLKEDLNKLEERLTSRLDRAAEERASVEENLNKLEKDLKEHAETRLTAVEERIKRELTNRIYGAAGVLAAVLTLVNYLMG